MMEYKMTQVPTSRLRLVEVTGVQQLLASQNPKRIGLIVSAPRLGNMVIHTETITGGVTGLFLTAGMQPIEMHLWTYGSCIRDAWNMVGSSVGTHVAVIEVIGT